MSSKVEIGSVYIGVNPITYGLPGLRALRSVVRPASSLNQSLRRSFHRRRRGMEIPVRMHIG